MNTPIESGWYWAKIDNKWEVVWFTHADRVSRAGYDYSFQSFDFTEWGERIERKDDAK